jgi:hypothetical protein
LNLQKIRLCFWGKNATATKTTAMAAAMKNIIVVLSGVILVSPLFYLEKWLSLFEPLETSNFHSNLLPNTNPE